MSDSVFADETFKRAVKKIAVARNSYALFKTNGDVEIVDIRTGKARYSPCFGKSVDIAGGFDHIIGLRADGLVVFESVGSQAPNQNVAWFGGIAVAACEAHSAMLKRDGTVLCVDYKNDNPSGYPPTPEYNETVEAWRNIKQIVLTYELTFALTGDGKFFGVRNDINDFLNARGKEIVQIDAFGCYCAEHTVAALYVDGSVKACEIYGRGYKKITAVETWRSVRKISCGNYSAVIGLTSDDRILIPVHCRYKDRYDNDARSLENIADIAANFNHLVALSRTGEVFYLRN